MDHPKWSWIVPLGVLLIGLFVDAVGDSWILAIAAIAAMMIAIWSFFLPVTFEITSMGLRRKALRQIRIVLWPTIRAYQLRSTGIALFQRPDPSAFDLASSLFVPYPEDADELVVAVRLYLPHAVELPT